jgi:hypothetical protein
MPESKSGALPLGYGPKNSEALQRLRGSICAKRSCSGERLQPRATNPAPARRQLRQHAPGADQRPGRRRKRKRRCRSSRAAPCCRQPGGGGGDFRIAAIDHRFAIIATSAFHEVGYCDERRVSCQFRVVEHRAGRHMTGRCQDHKPGLVQRPSASIARRRLPPRPLAHERRPAHQRPVASPAASSVRSTRFANSSSRRPTWSRRRNCRRPVHRPSAGCLAMRIVAPWGSRRLLQQAGGAHRQISLRGHAGTSLAR